MRKRYGDARTNLELSEKAFRTYSDTDPLNIFEEDDGSYTMTGVIEQTGLTAAEVNEWLEDLADEMAAADEEEEAVTFESILEKANDTTLRGKPVQVLSHLDDADLVQLYDLAPDMSYLTDPMDSAGKSIADAIFRAAGVDHEGIEEEEFDVALSNAVDKLREG